MYSHNATIFLVVAVPSDHPKNRSRNGQQNCKSPRATSSHTLQLASVRVFTVKVNDSTIRKRLNEFGSFGTEKERKIRLFFLKEHRSMA